MPLFVRSGLQGVGYNDRQLNNYVDTQILGIRDINVDIKFNGVPTVTMTLVDVQGKSLFQTGGNSPYSVFLYYPYPLFELTLKGFYGKAIKYELMLLNFQASFEASTGNYIVNLKFIPAIENMKKQSLCTIDKDTLLLEYSKRREDTK